MGKEGGGVPSSEWRDRSDWAKKEYTHTLPDPPHNPVDGTMCPIRAKAWREPGAEEVKVGFMPLQ